MVGAENAKDVLRFEKANHVLRHEDAEDVLRNEDAGHVLRTEDAEHVLRMDDVSELRNAAAIKNVSVNTNMANTRSLTVSLTRGCS